MFQSVLWLGYGLEDWDSIPDRAGFFTLRHEVETGCGAHLTFQFAVADGGEAKVFVDVYQRLSWEQTQLNLSLDACNAQKAMTS